MKVAGQVQNGGNQTNQKSNGPSSSSDHEDNAALEEWAATRIQNAFRKYKVTWIMDDILHYCGLDYWIGHFANGLLPFFNAAHHLPAGKENPPLSQGSQKIAYCWSGKSS
jgi:hypothetical protein